MFEVYFSELFFFFANYSVANACMKYPVIGSKIFSFRLSLSYLSDLLQ